MTNKNIPKTKYIKRGPTERDASSLYDVLVINKLNDIFNQGNDSKIIHEKLISILDHIDTIPNSFQSLVENPEARKNFTNVFIELLKTNDIDNINLFLKLPFVDLVNFSNNGTKMKESATDYLNWYIANTDINITNINTFCDYITNIILKCNLSSKSTTNFNQLKVTIENFPVDIYPKDMQDKLKQLFDKILHDKINPNHDILTMKADINKEMVLEKEIKNILRISSILKDLMTKFETKEDKEKHNMLLKQIIKSIKDNQLLELLSNDNNFTDTINLILQCFVSNNDILNISTLLNSELSNLITFQDSLLREKIITHLQYIIQKERLTNENIDIFISYIWNIVEKFKIKSDEFNDLKPILKERINRERIAPIKKRLEELYQ